MLGTREPEVYGKTTLSDIDDACLAHGESLGLGVECRQSNSESELIGWIQAAPKAFKGLVINAGAFTHTSVALHDALRAAGLPVIEVHLSNIYQREEFRHHSYISPVAEGVICGLGLDGYLLALSAFAKRLGSQRTA
jgi:3-dehydroquinate dehydratase-2